MFTSCCETLFAPVISCRILMLLYVFVTENDCFFTLRFIYTDYFETTDLSHWVNNEFHHHFVCRVHHSFLGVFCQSVGKIYRYIFTTLQCFILFTGLPFKCSRLYRLSSDSFLPEGDVSLCKLGCVVIVSRNPFCFYSRSLQFTFPLFLFVACLASIHVNNPLRYSISSRNKWNLLAKQSFIIK